MLGQCQRYNVGAHVIQNDPTFVEVFPFQQQDEAFDEMSSRTPLV